MIVKNYFKTGKYIKPLRRKIAKKKHYNESTSENAEIMLEKEIDITSSSTIGRVSLPILTLFIKSAGHCCAFHSTADTYFKKSNILCEELRNSFDFGFMASCSMKRKRSHVRKRAKPIFSVKTVDFYKQIHMVVTLRFKLLKYRSSYYISSMLSNLAFWKGDGFQDYAGIFF